MYSSYWMPLLFVSIALLLIYHARRLIQFFSLPTVQQYVARNPSASHERGGLNCVTCGSSSIYIWWLLGPGQGSGPKKHVCRSCGTDLYRS